MKQTHLKIAAGLLLTAVALCSQTAAVYQTLGGSAIGVENMGSQLVTGKPFSADEERRSIQTLADGTRILHVEMNRLYRDEMGRTRIERGGGNVAIVNPLDGFKAELNPNTAIAVKSSLAYSNSSGSNARLMKSYEELAQLRLRYTEESPQVMQAKKQVAELEKTLAAAGEPIIVRRDLPSGVISVQFTTASKLEAESRAQANSNASKLVQTDTPSVETLPLQTVNGLQAEGTRTTQTLAIGAIGNDRPIVIINEKWFSKDLQLTIKSSSSDPRFGDTTYQLTNIQQSNPDPSLFQIPANYTIRK